MAIEPVKVSIFELKKVHCGIDLNFKPNFGGLFRI